MGRLLDRHLTGREAYFGLLLWGSPVALRRLDVGRLEYIPRGRRGGHVEYICVHEQAKLPFFLHFINIALLL